MNIAEKIFELEQQLNEAIDEGEREEADELWVELQMALKERKLQEKRA